MFGLISDEKEIKSSLSILADEERMLGKGGVRSLSKTD